MSAHRNGTEDIEPDPHPAQKHTQASTSQELVAPAPEHLRIDQMSERPLLEVTSDCWYDRPEGANLPNRKLASDVWFLNLLAQKPTVSKPPTSGHKPGRCAIPKAARRLCLPTEKFLTFG